MLANLQLIQKRAEEERRNERGARWWADLNPVINSYSKCKSSKFVSKKAEVDSQIRRKAGAKTVSLIRNFKYGDTNRVKVKEWENRHANSIQKRAGGAVLIR